MHQHYFVHITNRFVRVDLNEIIYIESDGHHCNIVTSDKTFIPYLSLSQIEDELPKNQFARINRSIIVSIDKIDWFDLDNVCLKNKSIFSFGTRYRDELKKKVTIALHKESVK